MPSGSQHHHLAYTAKTASAPFCLRISQTRATGTHKRCHHDGHQFTRCIKRTYATVRYNQKPTISGTKDFPASQRLHLNGPSQNRTRRRQSSRKEEQGHTHHAAIILRFPAWQRSVNTAARGLGRGDSQPVRSGRVANPLNTMLKECGADDSDARRW